MKENSNNADANSKSDKPAITEYMKRLEERGYHIETKKAPADIVATKDGKTCYFEIKSTSKDDDYFGAATLTEWTAAIESPDRYWFVVARKVGEEFAFAKYTPQEFMKYSTIPPFKVYFNIRPDSENGKKRKSSAVHLTEGNLKQLIEWYGQLKAETTTD